MRLRTIVGLVFSGAVIYGAYTYLAPWYSGPLIAAYVLGYTARG